MNTTTTRDTSLILFEMLHDSELWLDYKEPNQWYTPRELVAISDAESGADRELDYDYEASEAKAYEAWTIKVTM